MHNFTAPHNKMTPRVIMTTSWDDGHVLDHKLAALLRQYGIAGTFYIAPEDHELTEDERLTPDGIRALAKDFEIGAHTLTHRHLTTLSTEDAYREIVESKSVLENMVGVPVTSFCYPAGQYTKEHANIARDAGFTYARTVKRFAYTHCTSLFEAETSVHTYDHWLDIWGLLKLVQFNPFRFLTLYRRWDKQACFMFDKVYREGGVFHLWGHSWEVDAHGDWERLEGVLQYIHEHNNIVYVSNNALT